MLMGEFEHSIDAKGRTVLPAKMRDEVGEKFVITCGTDGCLFGYPQAAWLEFEEQLNKLPITTNPQARKMNRFFLAKASECERDKQGRFPIPTNLREFAGLDKEVVIVGTGKRFEIWDKAKWNAMNDIMLDDIDATFASLEESGLSL